MSLLMIEVVRFVKMIICSAWGFRAKLQSLRNFFNLVFSKLNGDVFIVKQKDDRRILKLIIISSSTLQ